MLYGLMDCNNFFVSCERVFRPDLEQKPVVVLSNNDGCIVSRSNEAKEMAIPMGMPFFQLKDIDPLGQVTAFSSNYVLYADLSKRVMSILSDTVNETMPYSIDECFFTIDADHDKATAIAASIPAKVRKWTGIPVSVGLAPTKTLAKMACRFAKKYKGYNSFCAIDSADKLIKAMQLVKLNDIWGIGRRTIKTLNKAGLFTAADFCNLSEEQVRKLLGLNGIRTWQELRGEDSVKSETGLEVKKSICTSRSFAEMVADIDDLRPMVANFASQCASKLRAQGSAANIVSVFVASNFFRSDLQQYSNICNVALDEASASQIDIVKAADKGLISIFREGVTYKKAGVILSGITPSNTRQLSLFTQSEEMQNQKKEKLSKLIDKINESKGMNTVHLASQLPHSGKKKNNDTGATVFLNNLRRDHISPRYTTDWDDIIKVKS